MSARAKSSRREFLHRAGLAAAGGAFALSAPAVSWGAALGGEPIVIGHQCDLSGALAPTGYWRQKAANAAVALVNAGGGIAGRPLKVVTLDTQTNIDAGVTVLRQLIQQDRADFVFGSELGPIGIASNRVAAQFHTLYLPFNRTDECTGKFDNRYVFHAMVNARLAATAVGKWAATHIGKRWGLVYADYAWGQAHRSDWTAVIQASGGEVKQAIGIPVGTPDPLPYLQQADTSVDAYFIALLAPDLARVLPATSTLGWDKKPRVLADATFGAADMTQLQQHAEGVWSMDSLPFALADQDTPALRQMRQELSIDASGLGEGTKKTAMMGDVWVAYAYCGFLKRTIEGSGWKTKDDNDKLIAFAQSHPSYGQGRLFPQGPLDLRPADHQGFVNYNVLRIEKGSIKRVATIPLRETMYPAAANVMA